MSDTPAINIPGGLQDGPRNSQLDGFTRRRVLLKLSGEVFGGGSIGIDPDTVRSVAQQIAEAAGKVEIRSLSVVAISSAEPNYPTMVWTVRELITWVC